MLSRLTNAVGASRIGRLLSVPKGFGKFYPKGNPGSAGTAGAAGKTATAETGNAAKAKVNVGGGGGGGKKPDNQEGQWRNIIIGTSGVLALFFMLNVDVKSGR